MEQTDFKTLAGQMIIKALQAVDPKALITKRLKRQGAQLTVAGRHFDLRRFEHIYVLGFGKAVAPMAAALEAILGSFLNGGVVVVKYGYQQPLKKIRLLEAGHPVPDQNTLQAAEQILALAEKAKANDLVFVLISGGGSALFEKLPESITLNDLARFNKLLLACGADIEEMNTLRKHISLVKGGQLSKYIAPATSFSLILSDVIGDPLQSIASGPTAADCTTFAQAWKILSKYHLMSKIPGSIFKWLEAGKQGKVPETPKPGHPLFKKVSNIILGNNHLALKQLEQKAGRAGFHAFILSDRLEGEARVLAGTLASVISSSLSGANSFYAPACLILGGEPTVTLKGKGKGGRNQELVLAVLLALGPVKQPFYFCSLGTDGTDGPTDAAGAWIDEQSYFKAELNGLDMQSYLENNDSYHFFKKMDQLLLTGPTRTNVMDIMFCLF